MVLRMNKIATAPALNNSNVNVFMSNRLLGINSGYESYKERINQELQCSSGLLLDDCFNEEEMYDFYNKGESGSWIIESIKKVYK